MKINTKLCLLLVLLLSMTNSLAENKKKGSPTPMVDGSCSEYGNLETKTFELPNNIKLNFYQNADFVWFCYSHNKESYSWLDLEVSAPNIKHPINLHVSAQLGEWPLNNPEQKPTLPESDLWWNNVGWIANTNRWNGSMTMGEQTFPKFKPSTAREIQLSKDRFGTGKWHVRFKINNVFDVNGKFINVEYPISEKSLLLDITN